MSEDENTEGYELVMPFVAVASSGGPYDDEAFTAGWRMGALDMLLDQRKPAAHSDTVRTDDLPQVDMIAMRRGYRLAAAESEVVGWTFVELTRVAS